MKKKLTAFGIILVFAVAMFGCNGLGAYSDTFERVTEGDFIILNYKTEKYPEYDYVDIEGLSEAGKEKEIIVVPEYLLGKRVNGFQHSSYNGGPKNAYWRSDKLEKVYMRAYIKKGGAIKYESSLCPNIKKVIYIDQRSDIDQREAGATVYFSRILHEKSDKISRYRKANISYYWNYEESPNEGYYWLDDVDYGEHITFIPDAPVRDGYIFGGWYKEESCINEWDFESDTTPQEIKDADKATIYQETILYAKWIEE